MNYIDACFVNIGNTEGDFEDILDNLPNLLNEAFDNLDIDYSIEDIFSNSISLRLEGDKYDILEAIGELIQLLLMLNITNFHFTSHTVEEIAEC